MHWSLGCINSLTVKSMAILKTWRATGSMVCRTAKQDITWNAIASKFIHWSFEGCTGNRVAKFDTQNSPIRQLHISHNAPNLPPTILHNLCCSFLLGITAVPRENENNAYAKFWGANKVHCGRCASGEFQDMLQVDLTSFWASGASFLQAAKRPRERRTKDSFESLCNFKQHRPRLHDKRERE